MKTKYYLYGTILGLCMVPVVAALLFGPKEFFRLFHQQILLPLAFGYAAALVAGIKADRWFMRRGFFATVFILAGVYFAGVFFGCVANVFINGQVIRVPFGLSEEIWDWFVKPAYWFTVIGGPCAIVVGITHYSAHRLCGRWRAKQREI